VEVQIRVSGGDDIEEVSDLWEWLRGERELAGAVRAVRSVPGETELGGAFDMLTVAVGSGGAGTVVAKSLIAWLRTRHASVVVIVATETRTVTIKACDLDADTVVPLLRQVLSDDDG
jgi:Effector Associated Constant Component 1